MTYGSGITSERGSSIFVWLAVLFCAHHHASPSESVNGSWNVVGVHIDMSYHSYVRYVSYWHPPIPVVAHDFPLLILIEGGGPQSTVHRDQRAQCHAHHPLTAKRT